MVTFAENALSQTFTITALEDADAENELVVLVFENVPAGIGGTTAMADLTIVDNDGTNELRFEATVSEQIYQNGELVSLTLPEAVGGDGSAISYSLAGSPPPSFGDIGLSFDATTRVLSGTVNLGLLLEFSDTLTLTARDNSDMATLTFIVFTPVPHSVTDLTASRLGGGSRVILRWAVDPSSSQFAPDGYHVQVPNDETGLFVVCDIANLRGTRCFDSGEPGDSRRWQVDPVLAFATPPAMYRLRSFLDSGTFSEWVEVDSPAGDFALSAPAVVGSLAIESISVRDVTLTWSAPSGVITGYDITRIGPDGVRNVLDANFTSEAAATETVSFTDTVPVLNAGISYTYEVSAFNNAGYSPAARVSTPLVVISARDLTIDEGETAVYTVELGSEPGGQVIVEISGAGGPVGVSSTSLTFSASATPQTVTVTGVEDDNAIDETVSLIHAFTGGVYAGVSVPVVVSVVDNDRGVLSVIPVTVSEGDPATVSVRLDRGVASGFTVVFDTLGGTATASDTESESAPDYTATSGTLTFTGSAGEVQTFTVETVGDEVSENDETVLVSLSGVAPSELPIGGADGRANVAVTIADNDAGARLSASSVTVEEGGDATYTLVLTSEPTGSVQVFISSDNTDVSTAGTSIGFLLFSDANPWNVPQAVTVSAVEDDDNTDDERAALTHIFSGGGYGDVRVDNVIVSVTDNDEAILSVSPSTFTLVEGENAIFDVRLREAVSGGRFAVAVAARAGSAVASDYTVSPASLTFAGTEGEVQVFTVTALEDVREELESFTVGLGDVARFVGTGAVAPVGTRSAVAEISIAASPRGIVLAELGQTTVATEVAVTVGTSVSYTVKLASEPSGDVNVTVENTSGLTFAPASLDFTALNWNEEQTVEVSASGVAQSGVLIHTSSGSDYDATQFLSVTVVDELRFEATVLEQIYQDGELVSLTLPAAVGGDGSDIIYTLTPNLPSGLIFDSDPDSRVLSGTLAEDLVFPTTDYTLTARDDSSSASLVFSITVTDGQPAASLTLIQVSRVTDGIQLSWQVGTGNNPAEYEIQAVRSADDMFESTCPPVSDRMRCFSTIGNQNTTFYNIPLAGFTDTNDISLKYRIRATDGQGDIGPWSREVQLPHWWCRIQETSTVLRRAMKPL